MPLSYKLINGHIKIVTIDWMTNDNKKIFSRWLWLNNRSSLPSSWNCTKFKVSKLCLFRPTANLCVPPNTDWNVSAAMEARRSLLCSCSSSRQNCRDRFNNTPSERDTTALWHYTRTARRPVMVLTSRPPSQPGYGRRNTWRSPPGRFRKTPELTRKHKVT